MIKPSDGGEDDLRFKREIEEKIPKATRHLFLIRHGQYNMAGKNDPERVLTDKGASCLPLKAPSIPRLSSPCVSSTFWSTGIEQAKKTGDRIVALNFPYQLVVRSTMTRAQQTGDYILTRMTPGSVAIKDDKLLEEGSPYPAEPSNGSWRPEVNVSRNR